MRIFCFGLGYSALRLHKLHHGTFESFSGTTRSPAKAIALRESGIEVHVIESGKSNASMEASIWNADALLVSAAPDEHGDPILREFPHVLRRANKLRQIIYWSTVGVYGDHAGAWINEVSPLNAQSERGKRRIASESEWNRLGQELGISVQFHRLAGIYGLGRSVLDDYHAGTARRIIKPGQVFNRIHVDDIAGAAIAGLQRHDIQGAFNICDDLPCPPQDVVEYAGYLLGMPIPAEMTLAEANMSEMGRSFYSESKRCSNSRLKQILNYQLLYPNFREGLNAISLASNLLASNLLASKHSTKEKIG